MGTHQRFAPPTRLLKRFSKISGSDLWTHKNKVWDIPTFHCPRNTPWTRGYSVMESFAVQLPFIPGKPASLLEIKWNDHLFLAVGSLRVCFEPVWRWKKCSGRERGRNFWNVKMDNESGFEQLLLRETHLAHYLSTKQLLVCHIVNYGWRPEHMYGQIESVLPFKTWRIDIHILHGWNTLKTAFCFLNGLGMLRWSLATATIKQEVARLLPHWFWCIEQFLVVLVGLILFPVLTQQRTQKLGSAADKR